MSEATLREFLDRLNEDASYRESVQADPESAFAAFGLSRTERAALTSGDEDALRRLAGADTSGFAVIMSWMLCAPPRNTPGSGNHCGTGSCTPGSGTGCGTGTNG
jgi:hypothetical protein